MFSSLEQLNSTDKDFSDSGFVLSESSENLRNNMSDINIEQIDKVSEHSIDHLQLGSVYSGNFREFSESNSESSISSEYVESVPHHVTHDDELLFLRLENINPEAFKTDQSEIPLNSKSNPVYDLTNLDNRACSSQFDSLLLHNSDCHVSSRELSPNNRFGDEDLGCDNDVTEGEQYQQWKSDLQIPEWKNQQSITNPPVHSEASGQENYSSVIDLTDSPRDQTSDHVVTPPSNYNLIQLMNGFDQTSNYQSVPTDHHFVPFNQPIDHPSINHNNLNQPAVENYHFQNQPSTNQPSNHPVHHLNLLFEDAGTNWQPNVDRGTAPAAPVSVDLVNNELWRKFHEIGTEMIITKAGRRMFPSIKLNMKGLDPGCLYIIAIDILPVDNNRYRYVYHSSQWMAAGTTESCTPPRTYVHPDSPATGDVWMKQPITFDKLKLTNNEQNKKGHLILHSMHKYQPRIHLISCGKCTKYDVNNYVPTVGRIDDVIRDDVITFVFPECAFTTVTAYQNQQITRLKIDRNPFAKGFRDNNKSWKPRESPEKPTQIKRQLKPKETYPAYHEESTAKRTKLSLYQLYQDKSVGYNGSGGICIINTDNTSNCDEDKYVSNDSFKLTRSTESSIDIGMTSQVFAPTDTYNLQCIGENSFHSENPILGDYELGLNCNEGNRDVAKSGDECYVIPTPHSESGADDHVTNNFII